MQKTPRNVKPPKIVIPPAGGTFRVDAMSAANNTEKGNGKSEKRRDSSHITPMKGSETKKLKADDEEVSNVVLLQAITALTARFDTQDRKMEDLMDQMRKNSVMIAEISKAVEFNAAEIKDCKKENAEINKEIAKLNKTDTELGNRLVEMERYKRRWNLCINGLQEKSDEDPRREVER
ncbi:Puff II/9-2 protein [Labeo rohita]|uniref:Puff II/9-2 protein n=1 Tax=Labeo rohita TaxID=84645 RepID=A0ABQ8L9V7_LABRO|nr:Puff II/9-2 protein [Labeo rohita]